MHELHSKILSAKDRPSADNGQYTKIVSDMLSLIDSLKDQKITEKEYKLKMNNLYKNCERFKFQYKQEVHDWFHALLKTGSQIVS